MWGGCSSSFWWGAPPHPSTPPGCRPRTPAPKKSGGDSRFLGFKGCWCKTFFGGARSISVRGVLNGSIRLGPSAIKPLLRSLAASALLVWVAAQVVCTAHCNFGFGHGDSEQASCHGSAPSQAHHDDGNSPSPAHKGSSTSAACLTLKSALFDGKVCELVKPEFQLLYTLAWFAPAVEATQIELVAHFFRQARPRDWVFTPEVCLGPAFRSLAPPFSSLT